MTPMILLTCAALALALLYAGRAFLAWAVPVGVALASWALPEGITTFEGVALGVYAAALLALGAPFVRRMLISGKVLQLLKPIFPSMSDTERTALEAGTVWWDAELFSGNPDWKKLTEFKGPGLTEREKSFLENECEELCRMVDPKVVDATGDLPDEAWAALKAKGFMGMIIPEKYGGLGFSAEANSAVVTKTSSASITLGVTVMVPNSLGPAELLLHYGTEEQKDHYLPRLARGEEIPAFALTEPGAGSDAGSMSSKGVVEKGTWEGKEVVGIRLDWNKRYITLAPVATLLGVAFKLYDPEHLIGDKEDLGITCALVPRDLPGVEAGRRHDPLGVKFVNGPTTGKSVFIPLDFVIGGPAMAGQGWRMLMDCLSAGRSLSLPGLAAAGAQVTSRALSSYALLREQFNMSIGRFEGIEEPLSRVAGETWMMDATRTLTAAAVASGEKPSVVSAIVKAYLTEGMRRVVNDGMDVMAGAAICRGERNVLAQLYQGVPIGITVEGANILTRTLIIYGQGALRCHPFAFREMDAAMNGDLKEFDRAFFGHTGFIFSTLSRALVRSWSGGLVGRSPVSGAAAPYFKQLDRLSASFALCSEAAMATLGGTLKRKERLTGRLADALAWMYMGSAALKRYIDGGQREDERIFMEWAAQRSLFEIQEALLGFLQNLPSRPAARALKLLLFPFGRPYEQPSDRLSARLARALLDDDELRERLTDDIFIRDEDEHGLGRLDLGRARWRATSDLRKKLRTLAKEGKLERGSPHHMVAQAMERELLSKEEAQQLCDAYRLRDDLIQVDAFEPDEYVERCGA